MPVGSERPSAKFATTFSRLIALSFFVPLPFSIGLARFSASATVSMSTSSRLIDSAPMPPSK